MTENDEISKHIVTCAIEVHRTLGDPGLLESVYEEALCREFFLCALCALAPLRPCVKSLR
jgi:GxxExxY protein